jgi:hypothetical protein
MSKHFGLAVVAAGLILAFSGVADAAVKTRANTSRTVVSQNFRTGKAVSRQNMHRHHRRTVNVHHKTSTLNQAVAHRSNRHINSRHTHSRHVNNRQWNV